MIRHDIDFETASQLLAKASDDLSLVKSLINNDRQHDNCGYHLSQAAEKMFKFLCEISSTSYSRDGKSGHSLNMLHTNLMKNNSFSFITDYFDMIDLDVYGSGCRYDYVPQEERLNLNRYLGICQALFNEALREYKKVKE